MLTGNPTIHDQFLDLIRAGSINASILSAHSDLQQSSFEQFGLFYSSFPAPPTAPAPETTQLKTKTVTFVIISYIAYTAGVVQYLLQASRCTMAPSSILDVN